MARFKSSMITVEPFMFLCMNTFFLTFVSLPQLILDNVCLLKHNKTMCHAMFTGSFKEQFDIVQQESTRWLGGLLALLTFISILTLPFVGTMSDEFGRYAAMFLSPVSQLVQTIAFLGISSTGLPFPTWVLFLATPIPAIVGDISGLYVLAGSYIADITTEKDRTLRIALLEASAMSAGLTATLSSGLIIESFGYVGIFVTNSLLVILAILYLGFFVKPVKCKKDHAEKPLEKPEADNPEFFDECCSEKNEPKNVNSSLVAVGNAVSEDDPEDSIAEEHAETQGICTGNEVTGKDRDGSRQTGNDVDGCEIPGNDVGESCMVGKEMTLQRNYFGADEPILHESLTMDSVGENEALKGDIDRYADNNDDETDNNANIGTSELPPIDTKPCSKCSKEGKSVRARLQHIIKESSPLRNLIRVRHVLKNENQLYYGVCLLVLMGLSAVSYSGEMSVMALFLKNRPYFLTAKALGFYLAFESGMLAIVGLVIFNYLFTKIFKVDDYALLLASFMAMIAYFLLLAFSNSMIMLYLIQICHSIGSLGTCIIRSLLSKAVPEWSVGLLFGALLMVETSAIMTGTILCPAVYSYLAASYPGAVFFINAVLMLSSAIVSLILLVVKKRGRPVRN